MTGTTRNVEPWGAMLASVAIVCASLVALAESSVFPTGTLRYDPGKAFNSFILFTGGDNTSRLIDLNGNTVHQWRDEAGFSTMIAFPRSAPPTSSTARAVVCVNSSMLARVPGPADLLAMLATISA